jgi:hypothetical protein
MMSEKIWKWLALASVGVAAVLLLLLVGQGLRGWLFPKEKILERATLTLFRLERQNQLVTTRAFVQAVVRQRSETWYGNAEIIRIVPATIHYAVNLAELDRTQIEYDEPARVLYVPLPEVKILSIDPDLGRAETIRSLDLLRTEGGAGNELEAATEKMVRPALEQLGASPAAIGVARDQAITSVKHLLEAVLGATGRPVEVRPYFKSEGKAPVVREKKTG